MARDPRSSTKAGDVTATTLDPDRLLRGGIDPDPDSPQISLQALMTKRPTFRVFSIWLVGDTPLITHAWSSKARNEMLAKQVKANTVGKEARDPHADFLSSLYSMGKDRHTKEDVYGFPVTGVKNCILSSAHKDKGIAKTGVLSGLWLDGAMVQTVPAHPGARCDMPLVRIWGDPPEMREDMVRVGAGLNKTASLAYRAQFTIWAIQISGRLTEKIISTESFGFLLAESGRAVGLGEWRTEKKGMFGNFHVAGPAEQQEWNDFAAGKGPRPTPKLYQMPEAADQPS